MRPVDLVIFGFLIEMKSQEFPGATAAPSSFGVRGRWLLGVRGRKRYPRVWNPERREPEDPRVCLEIHQEQLFPLGKQSS